MNRTTKRIIVAVAVVALLVPIVIFVYPAITGSATKIHAGFLTEEGWTFDRTEAFGNGEVGYYIRGENKSESLIIRMRDFDTPSAARKIFAYDYNMNNTKDPETIDYKDMSFAGIYFNKFRGKGPWLMLVILDGSTLTELIYSNQEKGTEYSGDYTKDVAWLREVAVKLIGE